MAHPSQLHLSLSRAPQLPVALKQLRRFFAIWHRQTLISHIKVDGANRAAHHCLRGLVSNSFGSRFRGFVPIQGGLVVTGFAVDKAECDESLTLNCKILRLPRQRQRLGKRAKRFLGLAQVLVVVPKRHRGDSLATWIVKLTPDSQRLLFELLIFGAFAETVERFAEIVERFGLDGAIAQGASELERRPSVLFGLFTLAVDEVKVGEIVE